MDCFDSKKKIALWLDELLEADEMRALDRHLGSCPACREEQSRVERLFALGRSLPAVAPPESVWKRIQAALPRAGTLSWEDRIRAAWDRWREGLLRFVPSYAAGAASAALFLIVFFPPNRHSQDPGQLRPVSGNPNVSTAGLFPDAFPVRQIGRSNPDPTKRLVVQNGQLWEVDVTSAVPAVDFPIREFGAPAVWGNKDF